MVNPDISTARDLQAIPGLTPEIVKAILEARPFMGMAEFDAFLSRSLDRDQRSLLYQRIFLPINANASSDDEMRLVPGMGARLLLEVRESRPFSSLASLSNDIGKYLPPADVANLAQYLFIPLDVNSASEHDLATIPGMKPKVIKTLMQRRPYQDSAAVFKALRKHVAAKEAARLITFLRIAPRP